MNSFSFILLCWIAGAFINACKKLIQSIKAQPKTFAPYPKRQTELDQVIDDTDAEIVEDEYDFELAEQELARSLATSPMEPVKLGKMTPITQRVPVQKTTSITEDEIGTDWNDSMDEQVVSLDDVVSDDIQVGAIETVSGINSELATSYRKRKSKTPRTAYQQMVISQLILEKPRCLRK